MSCNCQNILGFSVSSGQNAKANLNRSRTSNQLSVSVSRLLTDVQIYNIFFSTIKYVLPELKCASYAIYVP